MKLDWINKPEVVSNVVGNLFTTVVVALFTLVWQECRKPREPKSAAFVPEKSLNLPSEVRVQQGKLDGRVSQFGNEYAPPEVANSFRPFGEYSMDGKDLTLEVGVVNLDRTIMGYGAGKVLPSDSPCTKFAVDLILSELRSDILRRSKPSSVTLEILGSADGIPVPPERTYRGEFGDFEAKYFSLKNPDSMLHASFRVGRTQLNNDLYALLRCEGMYRELQKSPILRAAPVTYFTTTTDSVGEQSRGVKIRVRISNYLRTENIGYTSNP